MCFLREFPGAWQIVQSHKSTPLLRGVGAGVCECVCACTIAHASPCQLGAELRGS